MHQATTRFVWPLWVLKRRRRAFGLRVISKRCVHTGNGAHSVFPCANAAACSTRCTRSARLAASRPPPLEKVSQVTYRDRRMHGGDANLCQTCGRARVPCRGRRERVGHALPRGGRGKGPVEVVCRQRMRGGAAAQVRAQQGSISGDRSASRAGLQPQGSGGTSRAAGGVLVGAASQRLTSGRVIRG